jgi:hypothetical protein
MTVYRGMDSSSSLGLFIGGRATGQRISSFPSHLPLVKISSLQRSPNQLSCSLLSSRRSQNALPIQISRSPQHTISSSPRTRSILSTSTRRLLPQPSAYSCPSPSCPFYILRSSPADSISSDSDPTLLIQSIPRSEPEQIGFESHTHSNGTSSFQYLNPLNLLLGTQSDRLRLSYSVHPGDHPPPAPYPLPTPPAYRLTRKE